MNKVLVWGIGADYDRFRRVITGIKEIDGFEIIALISSHKEAFNYLDNLKVILPNEINNFQYDYIVITSKKYFEQISDLAIKLGVIKGQIIPMHIFEISSFNFKNYIQLKENKLSIVSDDCWAGVFYSTYGLKFNSPFINTAIEHDQYLKLLENLEYYLKSPLVIKQEGSVSKFPIGCLGNEIDIYFWHYLSGKDAKECWKRRIERFNYDNFYVKMYLNSDDDAYKFSSLKLKNKIGFYYKDLGLDSVIYMKEWEDPKIRKQYSYQFATYIREQVSKSCSGCRTYDVLKLLIGKNDFIRKI